MTYKKILLTLLTAAVCCTSLQAQTAKSVLDKVSAVLSNKGGFTAGFTSSGATHTAVAGTIAVKGQKFQATTPIAVIWFDGKTQWTYMKKNEEVNVAHPTEAQLQTLNPYNFINIYKSGYNLSLTAKGNNHEVHLKAKDSKRNIQEMYITVDKKSNVPAEVRMLLKGKWTTITVTNFKKAQLPDSYFQFNAKDYPKAEIIDLR